VTVAWAALGAAAGLCLLHSRWLFDGGSWWEFAGHETVSAGRVRVCGRLVFDGQDPGRLAHRAVDLWLLGVAGALAAASGLAGVAAGRALPARLRRPAPGDPWLGLVGTVAVAASLAVTGVPGQDGESWWEWARRVSDRFVGLGDAASLGAEGLRLLALGVPVGWAVQAAAVAAGVRLTGAVRPEQAADYDDAVAAEPRRAPDRGRE
jgi:hypothetical protein